ncbi:FAD-dependent oxidoreductase [Cupriavidus consociatus]|uniref:FAD-dependent oxidoreductase n=1 Tax=Cupriavidus consociatus TaxID=2821357 RepID=UPI001AE2A247|nr:MULTISPECIES: FAD-dependent oxidoreductase [unclassified Cupriavidus]MBP0624045.1 FAD-dependent oxidoreductase [Cupriavidus sp. LEh25]MDK2660755.1 FAD-dependent oxidoreductase [Cupriavidus sp. LEh21]
MGSIANEHAVATASGDELKKYPTLAAGEIETIARYGSERTWRAGEYVVRTGDPANGMILVLEGRIRIVQRDGVGDSAVVVQHGPGNFLAEIGQLAGTPELIDGLAMEDVRAIVVRPACLRALMVAEAALGELIMQAMMLRRAALIQRGLGPTLIGQNGEPAMLELQALLRRKHYPYSVLDLNGEADAASVLQKFDACQADLPLVICPNGTILRRPDTMQILSCLGLLPELDGTRIYDVAIIGAGPAGLAAAVYAASEGLGVIVLDALAPGGQAAASTRIENYLGFPAGISGQALTANAYAQVQKFGAHIVSPIEVAQLECGPLHRLRTKAGDTIQSRTVIIASGAAYRRPPIPNLMSFEGRGIYYWASPVEGKLCAKQEVVLVGGGNSAGQAAVFLGTHAAHVHIVIRGLGLEQSMSRYLIDRIAAQPNITVHAQTDVVDLTGDGRLSGAVLLRRDTGQKEMMWVQHVFLFTGAEPNTSWLGSCEVGVDEKGFVQTGRHAGVPTSSLQTCVPGLFAIGDVRSGSTKRVATAVGEGAAVVAQIHAYLAATLAAA